jgi:hypothetical protein
MLPDRKPAVAHTPEGGKPAAVEHTQAAYTAADRLAEHTQQAAARISQEHTAARTQAVHTPEAHTS